MTILTKMRSAAVGLGIMAFAAGSAFAQTCEETQFTSKNAESYLKAETELLVNKNPQAALGHLNTLRAQDLNCYEYGAALRLGAGVKIQVEDYDGAIQDLLTALNEGYVPQSDAAQTYYNIAQIYLTQEDLGNSLSYMNRWIQAGGQPDRTQKWQLAVINQKLDNNTEALKWAEAVFDEDGPNAEREVYDFLIYLYDATGNLAKKAELLEYLLTKNPGERLLWDAISGDYFRAGDDRKAFEVQKAMYLGGILTTEDELMRVVNFYNQFNAPFQAAQMLEKEMNAGRIEKTYEKMELLANLYQVAREFKRAIPVIQEAAQMSTTGRMYERLGRSYVELQDWDKAEAALLQAIDKGGLRNSGLTWVLVGQARYEKGERAAAREAFRNANNRGGRGWLAFMNSEDATEKALIRFVAVSLVQDTLAEQKRCERLAVLGGEPTEECKTVDDRLKAAQDALALIDGA